MVQDIQSKHILETNYILLHWNLIQVALGFGLIQKNVKKEDKIIHFVRVKLMIRYGLVMEMEMLEVIIQLEELLYLTNSLQIKWILELSMKNLNTSLQDYLVWDNKHLIIEKSIKVLLFIS